MCFFDTIGNIALLSKQGIQLPYLQEKEFGSGASSPEQLLDVEFEEELWYDSDDENDDDDGGGNYDCSSENNVSEGQSSPSEDLSLVWQQNEDEGWPNDVDKFLETPRSAGRTSDYGWPVMKYPPLPVQPTWTSALPEFCTLADANVIRADGQTFEFISQFLADDRFGDIPFERSHGMVNFLLQIVTASIFETLQRWIPHQLLLLQVYHPDQLELVWWLYLLHEKQHECVKPAVTAGTNWDLLRESSGEFAVGQLRHAAVHRRQYSTSLIKDSVSILIALNDVNRFREVEQVIRVLYGTLSGRIPVTDDQIATLDAALALYPSRCSTVLDLLYSLSGVLENTFFRESQNHYREYFTDLLTAKKITVAEQLELSNGEWMSWTTIFGGYDIRYIRNSVAHRDGPIEDPCPQLDIISNYVADAKAVTLKFDDQEAAAKIDEMTAAALPEIAARSAAYKAKLDAFSVEQLRTMSEEADKEHRKWKPYRESERFVHKIAKRFEDSSRDFRDLADLKEGIPIKAWPSSKMQELFEVSSATKDD